MEFVHTQSSNGRIMHTPADTGRVCRSLRQRFAARPPLRRVGSLLSMACQLSWRCVQQRMTPQSNRVGTVCRHGRHLLEGVGRAGLREAGVEGGAAIKRVTIHFERMRGAAGVVVRLEHGDALAVVREERGAAEAADACATGGKALYLREDGCADNDSCTRSVAARGECA